MTAPVKNLTISRTGVELDGRPLLVADEPITVEHFADDLHIVRLAVFVEAVHAEDPAVISETSTTYSLTRD